jgi:hypothetical protein
VGRAFVPNANTSSSPWPTPEAQYTGTPTTNGRHWRLPQHPGLKTREAEIYHSRIGDQLILPGYVSANASSHTGRHGGRLPVRPARFRKYVLNFMKNGFQFTVRVAQDPQTRYSGCL